MRHRNRAARRWVHMRLSRLIWEWRQRAYLGCASGLAVFMLIYVSQARGCQHVEHNPPVSWPDRETH